MAKNARVRFDAGPIATIARHGDGQAILSHQERKELWYSREELMNACLEAKKIVKIINAVNGDYAAIDHSKVCVVGLEKFHGKKEREKYRKLLIKSVLIRQEMNRGLGRQDADCLCEISNMISSSFKEFALWQAAMHKFHANSCDNSTHPRLANDGDNGRSKRQRLDAGFNYTSGPSPSSSHMLSPSPQYDDPGQVRQEMQQIMAEFCS